MIFFANPLDIFRPSILDTPDAYWEREAKASTRMSGELVHREFCRMILKLLRARKVICRESPTIRIGFNNERENRIELWIGNGALENYPRAFRIYKPYEMPIHPDFFDQIRAEVREIMMVESIKANP